MSDRADLVPGDQLQNEFEPTERRRASGDGLDGRPPSRLIRSYDRQAVGQLAPSAAPPSYIDSEERAGGQEPKELRWQFWRGQQSAERGDYRGPTNAGYNQAPHQQQFQQQAPHQPSDPPRNVTVIRVVEANSGWSTYFKMRLALAVVGLFIAIPIIIWISVK